MRLALLATIATLHAAPAATVEDLLARGDAADAANNNHAALEAYAKADQLRPNDPDVLRRLAKQNAQIILETDSRTEKRRRAAAALEQARRAVAIAPDDAENRLTLAIVLGRAAFLEPPRGQVAMSKEIRQEAEAATKLDPGNDLAWHVLGRWHYEVSQFNPLLKGIAQAFYGRFPNASLEASADCFRKAIRTGPPRVFHHIEYGRTLAALGKNDEAIAQIQKGLALPNSDKDDPETKRRGRLALDKLEAR